MARKLIVEIVGDSRSYEKALGRSTKATSAFGRSVSTSSKGVSGGFRSIAKGALAFAGVAVGVRAIGGAVTSSVRASTDFEASLQKMIGLSGVAGSAIAGLRQDVLRLAPAVGKSPQELAEALFFITSSGIPASRALDVLTTSAQASAAGLGETKVVADAVTSALNAYGQANISSTQATDVLVATVREGKGEATEFAGVIGNVAAIAGELGVSFDQVGASLAAMTRLGTDAQTAAVQLQQVFSALLNTSPKVNKAFESVHLSLADTRKEIAQPGGFLPALQKIKTAFAGNTVALRAAFPEIRAFRGVLALVGKQSAPVIGIFQRLAKSTGSLGSAFGAITETQAQQFAKLNASIQVFKITLGSALAPAILDVVKPLNEWLSVSKNQEKVQKTIRETVRDLVGAVKDVVAVLKPLVTTTINVVNALGGFRDVLKALIPLFVASKIVGFAGAITGLSTQMLVATGRATALRAAMLRLGAIGVIAIGIELFIHRKEIADKAKDINRAINDALPGNLFGGGLGIDVEFKVENLAKLNTARAAMARVRGEDDARVVVLDRIIARLREIQGLTTTAPAHESRVMGFAEELTTRTKTKPDPKKAAADADAVIARITRQSAAQQDFNRQLADSEKRAAHLRDLIRADPDNAKLQKRLSDELQKQSGFRKDIVSAAKDETQAARDTLLATLDLGAAQAELTKSLQDDLAAAKNREATLKRHVALHRDDLDLAQQLVQATIARRDLEVQIAENRRDAKNKAAFKALGLTPEGERPTPSAGALLKRAVSLREQVKGTIFDTAKTRKELNTIVAWLKKNLKGASQAVRAAVLGMLNDISGAFDEKTGPLTKGSGLNTKKILEGMGLSPEEVRELRGRLSSINTAGRQLAPRGGNRPSGRGVGFGDNPPIIVQSHVYIDGREVTTTVTKQQQKDKRRNPRQKRGPNRIGGV